MVGMVFPGVFVRYMIAIPSTLSKILDVVAAKFREPNTVKLILKQGSCSFCEDRTYAYTLSFICSCIKTYLNSCLIAEHVQGPEKCYQTIATH